MNNPKYKNYAELSAAFKSGELDQNYFIVLDKGGAENCLCYHNPKLPDSENNKKQDECRKLFDGDYQPIESLFEALGIRAEWC